jgi:predicted nucleotidyltransferase
MWTTMSSDSDEKLVQDIVDRLKDSRVTRILLFGSRASGESGKGGDFDLAIVVGAPRSFSNYEERLEAKSAIRARLRDINRRVPIDLVLYTEDEFRELKAEASFLATEIMAKGRVLYEKAS